MLLGCREDENHVGRRFFECFEESVERRRRQHVNLVDDEYLIFADLRRYARLFHKRLDILHGVVACGVELEDIV